MRLTGFTEFKLTAETVLSRLDVSQSNQKRQFGGLIQSSLPSLRQEFLAAYRLQGMQKSGSAHRSIPLKSRGLVQ